MGYREGSPLPEGNRALLGGGRYVGTMHKRFIKRRVQVVQELPWDFGTCESWGDGERQNATYSGVYRLMSLVYVSCNIAIDDYLWEDLLYESEAP